MSAKGRATPEKKLQNAQDIAKYLLGDPSLGIEPLSMSEIQNKMNFAEIKSVKDYKKLAIKLGFLEVDENHKAIIPKKSYEELFRIYGDKFPLMKDPLMVEWDQVDKTKNHRQGTKVHEECTRTLLKFFNTVKETPTGLIKRHDPKYVEKLKNVYLEKYQKGTSWQIMKTKKIGGLASMELRLNYALASFCSLHGITWQRGYEGMNRRIVNHGKYSKEHLTKDEFTKCDKYLIEKYGVDSDEYRWFWVGIETCSRYGALFTMKLQWTESTNSKGKTTLFMQAYESKTSKKNDGMWDKWIKRQKTIEALRALKARGGLRIYENKSNRPLESKAKGSFTDYMINVMRDLYSHLGKDPESIAFKKPTHILRHYGCHYWLAKGNYSNHVLVGKIGGWHTIDELIKSYGELPPEKINEELDKYEYDEDQD